MQISGANLLLASQQTAQAAQSPAGLAAAAARKTEIFKPRDLTGPEPAKVLPAAKPQAGHTRPGAYVDVKV